MDYGLCSKLCRQFLVGYALVLQPGLAFGKRIVHYGILTGNPYGESL